MVAAIETTPFGDYLNKKIKEKECKVLPTLLPLYEKFSGATDIKLFKKHALILSNKIDQNLKAIKKELGGSVTPFSTFRGFFLEEVAIRLTSLCINNYEHKDIVVEKLGSGTGIITGALIKYRKGVLPDEIVLEPQRDREDVILGFESAVLHNYAKHC